MFNAFFAKRLFTVFALIALSAIPFQVYGESTTAFGKQGPYGVAMSEVSGEGLLLVPQVADGSQAKKQWPGIVFGHGLCGPARSYSDSLQRLCSWGFVIIANQEQEDCGVADIRNPIASMQSVGKLRYCVDSSVMAGNIKKKSALSRIAQRCESQCTGIGRSQHGRRRID